LFVEKPYFISYLDNFFIIPWLGFFLLGAAAAPVLYPDKKSLLPRLNTELNSPVKAKNLPLKIIVKPINYIGRHPIFFYAFNIAVSVLFMFLIGLIFIGTEWIADLLGVI
jgi:uncharacterized membrane protein